MVLSSEVICNKEYTNDLVQDICVDIAWGEYDQDCGLPW